MIEEQREKLHNAIEWNIQLCVNNAALMDANWEYSRESIRPEPMKT